MVDEPTGTDGLRADRVAQNDSAFRALNQALARETLSVSLEDRGLVGFVCECAERDCDQIVRLGLPKYEKVRANSRRFLVAAGHESVGTEDVVESCEGYSIVTQHSEDRRFPDPRF